MIREAIHKIVEGNNLQEAEMVQAMNEIMSGQATDAQIGAFITGLRMKGETITEITGAARVMRKKASRVEVKGHEGILVDTCGTGGDGSGTFNVSTAAAFVVAGAGLKVAKHGNRSISSKCGSADVLEALGLRLDLDPTQIGTSIMEVGMGFLFAPALHGAMKHAIGPRREIGVRTIFNILGPLTNPADANVQVMGVFTPMLTEKLATALGNLGAHRALVVCGEGNLDEITVTGETTISDYKDGTVTTYTFRPEDANIPRAPIDAIKGAENPLEAAAEMRAILGGEEGPKLNMALLNAGAAIMAAGAAPSIRDGVVMATRVVKSGAALEKLNNLVAFCRGVAGS